MLMDPKSKGDISEAIQKQFLEPLSSNPPEMLIIFYAGHGMGIGHDLFLLPTLAKYEDSDDRKEMCISHMEVLTWLKTYVDAHTIQLPRASTRPEVRFLLMLDICDIFDSNSTQRLKIFDPAQHNTAPEFWSMCVCTSRGTVASDGDSQQSPFFTELLDPTHGIFASSVPLKSGIENACARMREKRIYLTVTKALERITPDFCLDRTQDFDLSLSSSEDSGNYSSKRTRGGDTDMNDVSELGSAKKSRLTLAVKRNLPIEYREDEEGESNPDNAQSLVQQKQGGGRDKRPRTGAATHEESQAAVETSADSSSRRADNMKSNIEVSPAAHVAKDVEMRLRVLNEDRQETEVVVRVRMDLVDLSAHTGLLALPEALRGLTAMRELTVKSTALKTLPEWLGELCGLEVLRVRGKDRHYPKGCPLQTLPVSLGALTALTTLDLQYCVALTVLPESLGALTMLEDLDLSGCSRLKEVPAWVTGLHKLKVPVMEMRLLVMIQADDDCDIDSASSIGASQPIDRGEMEVVTHVRVDKVDLSAHVGLLALPEALRGLTAMRKLMVASTALKMLPEWLGELCGLEVLSVQGTHFQKGCPLQTLPTSIGALTGLKILDLQYCLALTSLPASLGALTLLKVLVLHSCVSLTVLPVSLGVLTGLEDLDVTGCRQLKEVPAWVMGLHKLKVPFMEVRLRVVSDDILHVLGDRVDTEVEMDCWEMEVVTHVRADKVDLSTHTGLLALPEALRGLTTIRELTVASTALKTLPEWLGELQGLEVLRVGGTEDYNFFESCPLYTLPGSICALTGLTSLNLRCMTLTTLPESLGKLTGLTMLDLGFCEGLTALPASLGGLEGLKMLILESCASLKVLPISFGALTGMKTLHLNCCGSLTALPASLGALTGLTMLDLRRCHALTALPASLGLLTGLTELDLDECASLHTPPPSSIVRAGTGAVLQFIRDLAKGEAPSHLIKVVLLGDQRAGKSSLADSLVLGRPATRIDNDRTVGIEVRRWRLGGQSQLVANIFDAAGQRVYRATHGFFMSPGALFLHVVRCDMPEDAAVAALLEWVEAVQQEAPGAVMGLVWTHTDFFTDGVCGGSDGHGGLLRVVGSAGREMTSWIAMRYVQQLVEAPCALKDVGIFKCRSLGEWKGEHGGVELQRRVAAEDVRGKVALFACSCFSRIYISNMERMADDIKAYVQDLRSRGSVGVLVIHDYSSDKDQNRLGKLSSSLCTIADIIPIMLILNSDAGALARPEAKLTAFPGWLLPCCRDVFLSAWLMFVKPRCSITDSSAMPRAEVCSVVGMQCHIIKSPCLTLICGAASGCSCVTNACRFLALFVQHHMKQARSAITMVLCRSWAFFLAPWLTTRVRV